jgi:hypothetical protein
LKEEVGEEEEEEEAGRVGLYQGTPSRLAEQLQRGTNIYCGRDTWPTYNHRTAALLQYPQKASTVL